MTVGPGCVDVGGGVGVGAVGECEQPIANVNTSPQSVRVTTTSPRAGNAMSY